MSVEPSSSFVPRAVSVALALIAALSVATFNAGVLPPDAANLQQYVVLALWACVIAATSMMRPSIPMGTGTDFYALVLFYVFAAVSVAWSDHSAATILKGAALSLTTFAAYRVATRLSLDAFFDAVGAGFVVICALSAALSLFRPDIGLDQTFMHQGQWQGVFESKQSLGSAAALLIFLACHRLSVRGGLLRFGLVAGLAAACVIGSGSRGGAAMAIAASLSLAIPKHWRGVPKLLAFGPLAITGVAAAAITYLVASGNSFLPLFGADVDFTERGLIWQYALSHFPERPLLGYGLNGFWSIDAIYHGFEREHGWVLDNYHDGYVGILMETGLLGMTLFAAGMLLFGFKMRWLISLNAMRRTDALAIIGFVNLVFFIDLTETFFLRSTNINSVALITLLFMSCRDGARDTAEARANARAAPPQVGVAA